MAKTFPVDSLDGGCDRGRTAEGRQVNRPEVARLIGKKRLLAAGVGGPNGAEPGRLVMAVDLVDEDQARVARFPGPLDDPLPDLADGIMAVIAINGRRVIAVGGVAALGATGRSVQCAD